MRKKSGGFIIIATILILVVLGAFYVRRTSQINQANALAQQAAKQASESAHAAVVKEQKEHNQFIASVAKPATVLYEKQQQVLPSIVVAQAILESDWGKSGLYKNANNPFGIKGNYKGQSVRYETTEVLDGKSQKVLADFKKYPNLEAAINDHNQILVTNYVKENNTQSYQQMAKSLQEHGYATDPDYTDKIVSIIQKYKLSDYDLKAING